VPAPPELSKNQAFSSAWQRLRSWLTSLRAPSSFLPLDEQSIRRLADKGETENMEFKERVLPYKKLVEYAVGIGNAGGGLLLMGIDRQEAPKARWSPGIETGRP